MIILDLDPTSAAQLGQALEWLEHRRGRDHVADPLLAVLDGIRRVSAGLGGPSLGQTEPPPHHELWTREEVAAVAGVQPDTVTDWDLPKIGRRYPAEQVRRFLRGERIERT